MSSGRSKDEGCRAAGLLRPRALAPHHAIVLVQLPAAGNEQFRGGLKQSGAGEGGGAEHSVVLLAESSWLCLLLSCLSALTQQRPVPCSLPSRPGCERAGAGLLLSPDSRTVDGWKRPELLGQDPPPWMDPGVCCRCSASSCISHQPLGADPTPAVTPTNWEHGPSTPPLPRQPCLCSLQKFSETF